MSIFISKNCYILKKELKTLKIKKTRAMLSTRNKGWGCKYSYTDKEQNKRFITLNWDHFTAMH